MNIKLKEMILHIAALSKDDPWFGLTKLNKILFTSDFLAFLFTGKSITESKYQHIKNGPAPKEMIRCLEELKTEGRIEIMLKPTFGRIQKRVNPLKGPNTSIFNKDELETAEEVVSMLKQATGTNLSEWTHGLIPWFISEDKEEIPYFTAFIMRKVPLCKDGISWGKQELKRLRDDGYGS